MNARLLLILLIAFLAIAYDLILPGKRWGKRKK